MATVAFRTHSRKTRDSQDGSRDSGTSTSSANKELPSLQWYHIVWRHSKSLVLYGTLIARYGKNNWPISKSFEWSTAIAMFLLSFPPILNWVLGSRGSVASTAKTACAKVGRTGWTKLVLIGRQDNDVQSILPTKLCTSARCHSWQTTTVWDRKRYFGIQNYTFHTFLVYIY